MRMFLTRIVPMFFVMITSAVLFCFDTDKISRLYAQETFAPLITDNCVGIVHVDLRKLELDRLKLLVDKLADSLLERINFDGKSRAAIKNELSISLGKYDAVLRPYFEITQKYGIRELAIIADSDLISGLHPLGLAIVLPWKDKTLDDLKSLAVLLNFSELRDDVADGEFTIIKNFLIIAPSSEKNRVRTWAKNAVSSKNASIYDALKDAGTDEIKFAIVQSPELLKAIKPITDNAPEVWHEVIQFAQQKTESITASVNFGILVSDTQKARFSFVAQMKTKEDAVVLRKLALDMADAQYQKARSSAESGAIMDDDLLAIRLLFLTISNARLKSIIPKVSEDRLQLEFTEK